MNPYRLKRNAAIFNLPQHGENLPALISGLFGDSQPRRNEPLFGSQVLVAATNLRSVRR